MDSQKFGKNYWCANVVEEVSGDKEIYLYADTVEVTAAGALEFVSKGDPRVNLVIAPGLWTSAFAASLVDGSAVAVTRWNDGLDEEEEPA